MHRRQCHGGIDRGGYESLFVLNFLENTDGALRALQCLLRLSPAMVRVSKIHIEPCQPFAVRTLFKEPARAFRTFKQFIEPAKTEEHAYLGVKGSSQLHRFIEAFQKNSGRVVALECGLELIQKLVGISRRAMRERSRERILCFIVRYTLCC